MAKYQKGQSGNPKGRPQGAKDRVPRSIRGMLAALYEQHGDALEERLLKGLLGRDAHRYFAIGAGLEKQQVEHTGPDGGPVKVVHEYHRD